MNGYAIMGSAELQKEPSLIETVLGLAGGIYVGLQCSRAWPAHPIAGFFLGHFFIGAPIGRTLGRALS